MYAKAKVNIALDGCRFLCFLPMEQTQKKRLCGFVPLSGCCRYHRFRRYRNHVYFFEQRAGTLHLPHLFAGQRRHQHCRSTSGVLPCCVFSKKAVKPVAESYEKQKRFITDASHEIKTPLTIIDANTEVIEMTNGENPVCHGGTGCNNKRRRSYLKAACLPSVRQCNQIWN